jgi:hypothetical protein
VVGWKIEEAASEKRGRYLYLGVCTEIDPTLGAEIVKRAEELLFVTRTAAWVRAVEDGSRCWVASVANITTRVYLAWRRLVRTTIDGSAAAIRMQ